MLSKSPVSSTVAPDTNLRKSNNGDAGTLILRMLTDFALTIESTVTVRTVHEHACDLFKPENHLDASSENSLERLYDCACDVRIQAVFKRRADREHSMMVLTKMSSLKLKFPWLNDDLVTRRMVELGKEISEESLVFGVLQFEDLDGLMGHPFYQANVNRLMSAGFPSEH